MCVCVCVCVRVRARARVQAQLCLTLSNPTGSSTCQAPLSMGFSWQEYWSVLPFPPPGDLPDPGIKPTSPTSTWTPGGFFYHWATTEAANRRLKKEREKKMSFWTYRQMLLILEVNNNKNFEGKYWKANSSDAGRKETGLGKTIGSMA